MLQIGDVVSCGNDEVGVMVGDVRYFSDCGHFVWVRVAAGLLVRVEREDVVEVEEFTD